MNKKHGHRFGDIYKSFYSWSRRGVHSLFVLSFLILRVERGKSIGFSFFGLGPLIGRGSRLRRHHYEFANNRRIHDENAFCPDPSKLDMMLSNRTRYRPQPVRYLYTFPGERSVILNVCLFTQQCNKS